MGSASSKAARKFPPAKGVIPSSARAPPPPSSATGPHGRAEDHKSDGPCHTHIRTNGSTDRPTAIKQDAADPDFLRNLHRLGPVKVDNNMQAFETVRLLPSSERVPSLIHTPSV